MASAIIPSWSSVQAVDHARVICSSSDSMGRDSGPLGPECRRQTRYTLLFSAMHHVIVTRNEYGSPGSGEGYVTVNVGWYPGGLSLAMECQAHFLSNSKRGTLMSCVNAGSKTTPSGMPALCR
jgi:hypothetical protein